MGLDNPIHIAFLLILLLLVFGAKRLPEMGRSLGSGMRGFKDALTTDIHPASELPVSATVTPVEPVVVAVAPVSAVEPVTETGALGASR
jgi:sec-independent protein translocase protein TatA